MKQDKAEKIIQKAERKAEKAAQQVQVATQKAEKAVQKAAERAEKKAVKQTQKATKKAEKEAQKANKAAQKAQKASQKAEEKRAKIAAAAAAAALEGTGEAEGGGASGKKGKKKLLLLLPVIAIAVGVGVFFFLKPKEPEQTVAEPIAAPAEYVIEETQIPAVPVWGDVTVYAYPVELETPEEGEEASTEDVFPAVDYVYEGLSSPKSLVEAYAALMTAEDAGFYAVDDTFVKIDALDFSGASGSVLLARNAPTGEDDSETRKVQTLLLSWEGQTCTVRVDLPAGRVKDPAPPPDVETGTVTQMIESLRDLPPFVLGLEGDSMDAYRIYTQDGTAKVDGNPCLRVNVYMAGGSSGNNQIVGSYFLSTDGAHVYRFDTSTNEVTELDIQDALQ